MKWLLAIAMVGGCGSSDGPVRRWTPVYSEQTCEPLKVTADGTRLTLPDVGAGLRRHWSVDYYVETLDVGAGTPNNNDGIFVSFKENEVKMQFGASQPVPGTVTMLKGSRIEVGGKVSVCVATPPGGVVLDYGPRHGQRIEAVGRIDAVIAGLTYDSK